MNLAWATGDRAKFFPSAFARFQQAGLNWSRIWMCHWGGTNLDWLPDDLGASPAPGTLDLRVALLLALSGGRPEQPAAAG